MKWKDLLTAIIIIIILFFLDRVVRFQKNFYYEPQKYLRTRNDRLNGIVIRIVEGKNLFGVVINNNNETVYPFTYTIQEPRNGWVNSYPSNFIQVGDSIYKNANNDTFYLIRGNQRWQYFLPK
jgi:hypothetical protein